MWTCKDKHEVSLIQKLSCRFGNNLNDKNDLIYSFWKMNQMLSIQSPIHIWTKFEWTDFIHIL